MEFFNHGIDEDEESALEDLVEKIRSNPDWLEVDISLTNTPGLFQKLIAAFVSVNVNNGSRLERLDLRSNQVGMIVPFLETVVPSLPSLRALTIWDCDLRTLTPFQASQIERLASNNVNLKELVIKYNRLGLSGAKAFAEGFRGNQSFEKVCLSSNDMGPEELAAVAVALKTTAVTKLSLGSTLLEDANNVGHHHPAAIVFVDALADNHRLEDLNLERVFRGDSHAASYFIRKVMSSHPSLRVLNLPKNNLTRAHVKQIVCAIKNNHNLKELDVGENNLGDDDAQVLVEGIRDSGNESFEKLALYSNQIGPEGLSVVAAALSTSLVKDINLSRNSLGSGNLETILFVNNLAVSHHLQVLRLGGVFQEADPSALLRFIERVLPSLPFLRDLKFRSNKVTCLHAAQIALFLQYNHTLQVLDLGDNVIADRGCESIATSLRYNTTLTTLDLSENPITSASAASLELCLFRYNYTLVTFWYWGGPMRTEGIKILATQNQELKDSLQRLQEDGVPIPISMWPRVGALAEEKRNELLYWILKSDPTVMQREEFQLNTPNPPFV